MPKLQAVINAPSTDGEYLLMVYAKDNKGGASASTLSIQVTGSSR